MTAWSKAALSNPPSLLVCATEISGDVRGARLATELRRAAPGVALVGLGGEHMRGAGVEVRIDITDKGTVGWFDHWRDLPCYASALRFWRRELRARRPTAAIVIDAPGISFPFARVAHAAGVPVAYFVTPQTWLWNARGAVERLRTHADIVVPTIEAEAEIYARARLPVIYEGHPAVDELVETYGDSAAGTEVPKQAPPLRPADGQPDARPTIAIVPGSRRHAVRRLLPIMLAAADRVRAVHDQARVIVSVAASALRNEVERQIDGSAPPVEIVEANLASVLRRSDVALSSTGGNLLEAVYAGTPVVGCYRVDAVTHAIAKYGMRLQDRVSAFALPNLVAGERIVPELIQSEMTPGNAAAHALRLLADGEARARMREGYGRVRDRLGRPGVNARIARELLVRLGIGKGK